MAKADGTIIINTKIDTDGIKEGIGDVKKELSFGDIIKGSAIGSAVASVVQEAVSGIRELGAAFIESAASVKAETSMFEQTFKKFGDTASAAIGGIAQETGILETRMNTLGSRIYSFAMSSGATTDEAMSLMEDSLRAAADSAAYYDRSLEDTTETLQSFLKGNYENDAALGVSATETTRNAKAMELFGQKFNDLSEIQKQQTLLKMVTDAQELSGAMGQAAREADGWENVQGNLNESIRQFQAAAGEPFLNQLVPIVKNLSSAITNLTNTTNWGAIEDGINGMVETFKTNGVKGLINSVMPMVTSFTETLRANAGKFIDAGLDMVVDLAKGLADGLPTLIEEVPKIVSNIAGIINDNAPKLITTAGKLILTLGKGLIQAIPTLVKNIPNIIKAVVDVFLAYNWLKVGKNAMTGLKNGIVAMKNSIKSSATTIKNNIYNAIKSLPTQLKKVASNAITQIKKTFSSAVSSWKNIGKQIINGIISGVSNASGALISKFKSLAKSALNAVKSFFGIHSPSRVFRDEVGEMLPPGITEGVDSAFPNTIKALKKQIGTMVDTASDLMPSVMEFSIPIMATGTVLPAGAGMSAYAQYGSLGEEIRGLKELLLSQRPESNTTNSTIHVTAECQRKTLFDLVVDEGRLRMMQSGKNPFKF